MKKLFCSQIVCVLAFLILTNCTVIDVEEVPLASAQPVPAFAHPSPVGFNKIRYAIPTGTPIMGISMRDFTCPLVMKKVKGGISSRSFPNDIYKRLFQSTFEGLGYDVTGDPGRMFDEIEDMQRTLYSIGARVVDIKMDVCTKHSFWFGYEQGMVGEAMVEIEWSVYDMLDRQTAYKVSTKGYSDLSMPNDEGLEMLLEESFVAAAHNLGADQTFNDLIFHGIKPVTAPSPSENNAGPRLFDPREDVVLPKQPLFTGRPRIDDLRKVAVMIESAGGHGSGFFITKQGHIITNAHVVGHASRVRVVPAGKKQALKAEVLRVDTRRDVALLRVEDMPHSLNIMPLPVRLEKPAVGEDIYAIGTPSLKKLQDTVTKGIVSAHRYDKRKDHWTIQGDVEIHGGSSGGPLLDAHGNIVGLSVAGYVDGKYEIAGLNLFIPIADALDKLVIDIAGTSTQAPQKITP